MISLIESGNLANTENNPMIPRSAELVGLSTDTKPTGMSVGNGWSCNWHNLPLLDSVQRMNPQKAIAVGVR